MKKDLKLSSENSQGRTYWRSQDHLAETEEFRSWLDNEFPSAAREADEAPSRRDFMKIMSASFLLAGFGLTGCRRPEEVLIPFSTSTGDYIHGVAEFFATTRISAKGATPLLAKSADGRPVKLERNPIHSDATGTSASTQASVLDLYDPDRLKKVKNQGADTTKEQGDAQLAALANDLNNTKGEGFAFLLDKLDSPSRDRIVKKLQAKYPQATWHQYDPVCPNSFTQKEGDQSQYQAFYHLDKAHKVVSFGGDFLGKDPQSERNARDFAKLRKLSSPDDKMNRLYVVESAMTDTGASADHRLRLAASQVELAAYRLAIELLENENFQNLTPDAKAKAGELIGALKANSPSELFEQEDHTKVDQFVQHCSDDIFANAYADGAENPKEVVKQTLFIAGPEMPKQVHELCLFLNATTGAIGNTVEYKKIESKGFSSLSSLAKASSSTTNLIMIGGNPVYDAPADLNWAASQSQANVWRLSDREDESSENVKWSFPRSHFLESWGDANTADGTYSSVQPLIAPLYDSYTDIEFLSRIAGEEESNPHKIVQETFRQVSQTSNFDNDWRHFIHDGFLKDSYFRYSKPDFSATNLKQSLTARKEVIEKLSKPSAENLQILFLSDSKVGAGEGANNGWLQELPDSVTKITWDNVILMSPKTAADLGLPATNRVGNKYNQARIVEVEIQGRKISGPVWVQSGFADHTLGLVLGYGRTKAGRVGNGVGYYNASAVRTFGSPFISSGAKVSKSVETIEIACTQDHGSMEGRPIVREANLDQFQKHPEFAEKGMGVAAHFPHDLPYKVYDHPYTQYEEKAKKQKEKDGTVPRPIIKSSIHQWAMTIDLNACTGCNACVVSCQAENNIPVVGKDQVRRGREMHWIRIDRYFSAPVSEDGKIQNKSIPSDPQISLQPMACVQCENAPCESVCPVNATIHDEEGLNLMVYNRCVGTRYCSNNCPYKVRRFNFFDYNLRPLDNLYASPLTGGGLPRKPADEYELMKLVRNPDVSARMRGVMEKCTYCVQRIEDAKINQKIKAGASGDVEVPDGTIKTACQDACPADAITFGNKLDPDSEVSKSIANPRNYKVLGYLETLPRTTHLARVRNPYEPLAKIENATTPFTTQEHFREDFKEEGADPFESHHGHHDDHHDDHKDGGHKDGEHKDHGKEAAH